MVAKPNRFDVWLVNLDPTIGSEIQKTRPAVVVSPDEMNRHLRTVIMAPMTSQKKPYPTRVAVVFKNRAGDVALEQLRTLDTARLVKKLGCISPEEAQQVCETLVELFSF